MKSEMCLQAAQRWAGLTSISAVPGLVKKSYPTYSSTFHFIRYFERCTAVRESECVEYSGTIGIRTIQALAPGQRTTFGSGFAGSSNRPIVCL